MKYSKSVGDNIRFSEGNKRSERIENRKEGYQLYDGLSVSFKELI